jgi:hypothetical protein
MRSAAVLSRELRRVRSLRRRKKRNRDADRFLFGCETALEYALHVQGGRKFPRPTSPWPLQRLPPWFAEPRSYQE